MSEEKVDKKLMEYYRQLRNVSRNRVDELSVKLHENPTTES